MIKKSGFCFLLMLLIFSVYPCSVSAQEPQDIQLPKPQTDVGKPLMQALALRQSSREFSGEKLPLQVLSNLLWAADGVNRPDSGKRTAPSAMNMQNIDIYAAIADGVYLYDPAGHILKLVLKEDISHALRSASFIIFLNNTQK